MKQILEKLQRRNDVTVYCNNRITDYKVLYTVKNNHTAISFSYLAKVKQTCILSLGLDVTEGLPTGIILEEPQIN